ncbi:restriction endonuclease [Methylobacterium sp. WL69]|uniref:restriction endonuclease n=1 Tax=Methylobacterium sp. WL69 TaxID=2603893 RepID=UPI0011C90927|nr:restriction endonuclease [Methylobacterium sp. WL69]TXM68929.1 restriction endonuclease [Methylobacterium sp. WL69]
MPGRSSLVARLFWTTLLGGGAAFVLGAPAVAATGLCLAALVLHRLDRPRRIRRLIRTLVRQHAPTLALRRRQECFVDAYGNLINDGWVREREYFAERTILPALDAEGFGEDGDVLWDMILASIERAAAAYPLPDAADAPADGIAYERFCAERLREAGWNARATQASGDQGADIVAERAGIRLVVQCKRYGKPVGNGAVQEIAAAMRYWSGDMAAVVSNAGFTPSARKLAAATGVELLHHDDLATLTPVREVGGRKPTRSKARSSVAER